MCSIFASYDANKLRELQKLNNYRGSHSWSFFRPQLPALPPVKALGKLDLDFADDPFYKVCHQQAPTTQNKTIETVHPSEMLNGSYLWHNGIIKSKYIEDDQWDTAFLHRSITNIEELHFPFDGSYACLYYNADGLYMFRNPLSPLFIDDNGSISSTKFISSYMILPYRIYKLGFYEKQWKEIGRFTDDTQVPYSLGENN